MSVHMKKNGAYFVRYRQNGKQVQKGFGKGEQAQQLALNFDASIRAKVQHTKMQQNPSMPSVITYIDELALNYFNRNPLEADKDWVKDWKKLLNKHILPELGQIPIANLTEAHIVNCIIQKFPKAKAVTHGLYLSYLKIMFNYGVKRQYIKSNPLQFWSKPQQKQKAFNLDLNTIMKIRNASPPHLAFAIEVMCNTGVRTGKSELLSLKWEHVLWDESAIRVFATKTQQWRTIPLKPNFMQTLRAKQKEALTDYLVEYQGRQIKSMSKAFREACKRANVSTSTILYDIRHWYCTTLLSSGVPVKTVSQLMGHSSATMTLDKYAHVMVGDTKKAILYLPTITTYLPIIK